MLATAAAVTTLVGIAPTDGSLWIDGVEIDDGVVLLALAAIWILSMAVSGAYEAKVVGIGSEEYKRLCRGALGALATTAFLVYTFRIGLNRAFLFVALALATVLAGALRQIVRKWLHRARARAGATTRRVLVVGTRDTVGRAVRHFSRARSPGSAWLARAWPARSRRRRRREVPVSGALDDVVAALTGRVPTRSRWPIPGPSPVCAAPPVLDARRHGDRPDRGARRSRRLAGLADRRATGRRHPVARTSRSPRSAAVRGSPRRSSTGPSCGGTRPAAARRGRPGPCRAPHEPGPVLVPPDRVGRDGREFKMLKFRTMVDDAEASLERARPGDAGNGVLFKVRTTPGSRPSAGGSAATRSTSCRSCGT